MRILEVATAVLVIANTVVVLVGYPILWVLMRRRRQATQAAIEKMEAATRAWREFEL